MNIQIAEKIEVICMYGLCAIGLYCGFRNWLDLGIYAMSFACFIRIGVK